MGPQIEPTVVAITSLMLSLSASVRDEPVMPVSCTVPDTVGDVDEDPVVPVAVVLVPVQPARLPPLEVMAEVMAVLVTLVRAVAPAVAAASVCTLMV